MIVSAGSRPGRGWCCDTGGYGTAIERLTQIVALLGSSASIRSLPSIAKLRLVGAAQTITYLKRFPDWGPSIPSLLNYIHEGTEWVAHRPCLKNDGSHRWIPHQVVCFDCTCQSGCCKGDGMSLHVAWHRQWHGISWCPVWSVTVPPL